MSSENEQIKAMEKGAVTFTGYGGIYEMHGKECTMSFL